MRQAIIKKKGQSKDKAGESVSDYLPEPEQAVSHNPFTKIRFYDQVKRRKL